MHNCTCAQLCTTVTIDKVLDIFLKQFLVAVCDGLTNDNVDLLKIQKLAGRLNVLS